MRAAPILTGLLLLGHEAHALDPDRLPSQYVMQSWDMDDGLPMNGISHIAIDGDGFVWFASPEGGGWFDGVRVVRSLDQAVGFARPPSGSDVGCFLQYRGKMFCESPQGIAAVSDVPNRATSMARDADGRVWISSHVGGLFLFDDAGMHPVDPRPSRVLVAGTNGEVWAGSWGSVLRIEGGTVTEELPIADPKPSVWVESLAIGRDSVWVGSDRMSRIHGSTVTEIRELAGMGPFPSVLEDRDANLWIGTRHGLLRWRDGRVSRFPAGHLLADGVISSLAEDREGGLWVASPSGLHRLQDGAVTVVGVQEGLLGRSTWTFAEDSAGGVLIGSSSGVQRYADGRLERVAELIGTRVDAADMSLGASGDVWITAGLRSAIFRIRSGKVDRIDLRSVFPTEDPNNDVWKVQEDRRGDLWISTNGTNFAQLRDGRLVRRWRAEDGLLDHAVTIGMFADGALWIAGQLGVNVIRNGSIETIRPPEGDYSGEVSVGPIVEDAERLWMSTGHGIALWDGRWKKLEKLPGNMVFGLVADDLGFLWAATNIGIYRFSRSDALASIETGAAIPVRWFGTSDGMRTPECNGPRRSTLRARDGTLWFATADGAVHIDPRRIAGNPVPPSVRVIDARIDGEPATGSFPAGTKRFEIRYAASTLRAPRKARFQYRLDGFDADWVEAENRRTAFYTNVPPGEYRFRVRATNEDGVRSEREAVLPVVVLPFFFETRWFTALVGLACVGLVAGAVRLRTRQLRLRAAELEREIEEATRLLAARMDEKLARTGQVARFGEFAASVAHNLKTPLTFLRGEIELLDEKRRSGTVAPAELESALRALLEQVRRMNTEIDAGMSFVRPGAAPIVDVDLAALAREIGLLLRSRAAASKVKIDVAIDGELRVRGNLDNLRHAIANLVSNAIDAMPDGGSVAISGRRAEGFAELRVADTGPGIPESVRAKLFRPFVSTKGEQGTGLGLASCRRIVEDEHGGRIRLEPASSGAVFVVEIPS